MTNLIFIGKYTLCTDFQTAGAKRVLNQIKYLVQYFDILVITLSKNKSKLKFNVNIYTNENNPLIYLLYTPIYWLLISIQLIKRKKEKNYLILESTVELYSSIPILIAKFLGYKIIHDIVEDFSLKTNKSRKQKINYLISELYLRNVKKYCSGLIVISERLLIKYQNYNLPIIKLYNSVEKQSFTLQSKKPKSYTFFYSGTFNEKDGVLDLISAFNLVQQKTNEIHLELVGKGYGLYYKECLNKISNNKNIKYHGYLPEYKMFDLIKKSHILCITRSNSEFANNGFPFKLAEYMSFGIPIITTTVSDIPLILNNNINVFFAEPENIESIAKTMEKIINNYTTSINVGINGKIYCENNFSITNIGSKLKAFIDNV